MVHGLPAEEDPRIAAELVDGEVVLYASRVSVGHLIGKLRGVCLVVGWLMVLSGCGWAVGIVLVGGQARMALPWLLMPVAIVPVIGGCVLLWLPRWMAGRLRDGLCVVTDARCIAWVREGVGGEVVQSFWGDELGELRRRDRGDGVGDLIFSRSDLVIPVAGSVPLRTEREHGFFGVHDVAGVERLVRETFGV